MYTSTASIMSAASTITGSIISVPTSTTQPQAQPPRSRDPLVRPPMIYQEGKHNDHDSDDDECGHGYLNVQ